MKRYLFFIFVLAPAITLLTCSKKSSGPAGPEPPVRTPFEITYTADPSRSVSQRISASAGGTIEVRNADSVTFNLSIPPHALRLDTTITITPLSVLEIGGPTGAVCAGCIAPDSMCCHHGALFEPAGLRLDSSAVITVQFPPGKGFPFAHDAAVVYFDSAAGRYAPCITTCDSAAGRLLARITHFSGYGSDDPSYDQQEEAIYQALDLATGYINSPMLFYPIMRDLEASYFWCSGHGDPNALVYSDLMNVIENQTLTLWTRLVNLQRQNASNQNSCDAMYTLHPVWATLKDYATESGITFSNASQFSSLALAIKSDLMTYFNETAQKGRQLCLSDSCDAGREQLSCALTHQDVISDQALLDTVGNWLLACNQCGVDVAIYADKGLVHKVAVSEGDAENCVVRYSAGVHNNVTNEPIRNSHVQFHELSGPVGTHFIGSCDTDSLGHCEIIFRGADSDRECQEDVNQRVFAEAVYNNKAYYSDTVTVAIKGLRLAVTIDFHYDHRAEGAQGYLEAASASIIGTVTATGVAITQNPFCMEGNYTRTWTAQYEYPVQQTSSTGRMVSSPTVQMSLATCRTDSSAVVPGTTISVPRLSSVTVGTGALEAWFAVEWSGANMGNSYCDTSTADYFDCGDRWYCTPINTPPVFYPVNGTFEPYRYTQDTLGNTVTQTVTVNPVF